MYYTFLTALGLVEDVCGFFPCLRGFGENDHLFPTCVLFFFTLYARIGPQWLSELRRLWPNVP